MCRCPSNVHLPRGLQHMHLGDSPSSPFPGAEDTRGLGQTLCSSLVAFKQCFREKHNAQGLFRHTTVEKCFEAVEELQICWMWKLRAEVGMGHYVKWEDRSCLHAGFTKSGCLFIFPWYFLSFSSME